MTPEWTARVLLRWALDETNLRIPRKLERPAAWRWSEDDQQLVAMTDDGEYRYHTALTHGRTKVRHAVLTVTDDNGKVKWEANIPADVYAQAKGGAA